jgi:hypothetical protein
MSACLHLPLDFESSGPMRLFARKLAADGESQRVLASLYALRIWIDWGMARVEWRPLKFPVVEDPSTHSWDRENLSFVIEEAARWTGKSGALLSAAVESGLIEVIHCPDQSFALSLAGFWALNEHLSPSFKTIQQIGNAAMQAKKALQDSERLATERRKIFESQGILPFDEAAAPTPTEQEACYALFMRIYRVCDLPLPDAAAFTSTAMHDTLKAIRNWTPTRIAAAEAEILSRRTDVDFVKNPARIIENFAEWVKRSSDDLNQEVRKPGNG